MAQGDGMLRVPVVFREIDQGLERAQVMADVVDQYVEFAEARGDLIAQTLDLGSDPDIAPDYEALRIRLLQRFAFRRVDLRDNELCTERRKGIDDGMADARAAAGYERVLALERNLH